MGGRILVPPNSVLCAFSINASIRDDNHVLTFAMSRLPYEKLMNQASTDLGPLEQDPQPVDGTVARYWCSPFGVQKFFARPSLTCVH